MERKLTAILHADVQGYSRLIAEDDVATLRTLTAYLEMMEQVSCSSASAEGPAFCFSVLGEAYYLTRRYEEAISAYTQALTHKPLWILGLEAHLGLAASYRGLRRIAFFTNPMAFSGCPVKFRICASQAYARVWLGSRAMTNNPEILERSVMRSSVIPSLKYSCSGSPLMLVKGNTAMEGLSGNGRAVVSSEGTTAEGGEGAK